MVCGVGRGGKTERETPCFGRKGETQGRSAIDKQGVGDQNKIFWTKRELLPQGFFSVFGREWGRGRKSQHLPPPFFPPPQGRRGERGGGLKSSFIIMAAAPLRNTIVMCCVCWSSSLPPFLSLSGAEIWKEFMWFFTSYTFSFVLGPRSRLILRKGGPNICSCTSTKV